MLKPYYIIHHTANPAVVRQFLSVNSYHKSKGFPLSSLGFYVGYQFFIEKHAFGGSQMIQARAITDIGAHTAAMCPDVDGDGKDDACNWVGIGVCLAGDFTTQEPTDSQLQILYDLWKALGFPRILLHSDTKKTSCPGNFPFRDALNRLWLSDLKQQLKNTLHAMGRYLSDTVRGRMLRRRAPRLEEDINRYEKEMDQP